MCPCVRHNAQLVRHRIDGLEKSSSDELGRFKVRHRIDGLENPLNPLPPMRLVRHRIDGLERE